MREIIGQIVADLPGEQVTTGRISPSNTAPVVRAEGPLLMRFGLTLSFRKGLQLNARSEGVKNSPLFSPLLKHSRCLIPANEFYEWDAAKNPHLFRDAHGALLYMAALYRKEEQTNRFVIITKEADEHVGPVHSRMPLLLPSPEYRQAWLASEQLAAELLRLPCQTRLLMRSP